MSTLAVLTLVLLGPVPPAGGPVTAGPVTAERGALAWSPQDPRPGQPGARGAGGQARQDPGQGPGGGRGPFGGARGRPGGRPGAGPAGQRSTFQDKVVELQKKARARRERGSGDDSTPPEEDQVAAWFAVCDHNENGWLSYSEAAYSLRFSRQRFQAFDEDRDGRLAPLEFDEYYVYSLANTGQFVTPREKRSAGSPPSRTPEQLRNAYDTDLDGELSLAELTRLLADYERDSTSVEVVLGSLDASGNELLSIDELGGLHAVLYPLDVEPDPRDPKITSYKDLFYKVVSRTVSGGTPNPPLIVGPVSHFLRLDLDDDGYITVEDLQNLLRPVRTAVRPHTVINTLDRDGDMRLSEEEFLAALIALGR